MTTKKKLTHKERMFIAEYLVDGNGSRSARAAGYSDNGTGDIRYEANKLLSKPHIVNEIIKQQEKRVNRLDITIDMKYQMLWDAVQQCSADGDYSTMKNCIAELNKMQVGHLAATRTESKQEIKMTDIYDSISQVKASSVKHAIRH